MTSQGRSLRVLIVDDNADITKVLSVLVEHSGHVARMAYDAVSSIELAREFQPDVALLDIGLPGMSGYELAQRLRCEKGLEKTLLVALTGYSRDEDRKRAEESGFAVHLVKPVTVDALQQVLQRVAG